MLASRAASREHSSSATQGIQGDPREPESPSRSSVPPRPSREDGSKPRRVPKSPDKQTTKRTKTTKEGPSKAARHALTPSPSPIGWEGWRSAASGIALLRGEIRFSGGQLRGDCGPGARD